MTERGSNEGADDSDPQAAETDGGTHVTSDSVDAALDDIETTGVAGYNYAYLDEHTKREVRRAMLKAVAIPGHQVPYASRPMPLAEQVTSAVWPAQSTSAMPACSAGCVITRPERVAGVEPVAPPRVRRGRRRQTSERR